MRPWPGHRSLEKLVEEQGDARPCPVLAVEREGGGEGAGETGRDRLRVRGQVFEEEELKKDGGGVSYNVN